MAGSHRASKGFRGLNTGALTRRAVCPMDHHRGRHIIPAFPLFVPLSESISRSQVHATDCFVVAFGGRDGERAPKERACEAQAGEARGQTLGGIARGGRDERRHAVGAPDVGGWGRQRLERGTTGGLGSTLEGHRRGRVPDVEVLGMVEVEDLLAHEIVALGLRCAGAGGGRGARQHGQTASRQGISPNSPHRTSELECQIAPSRAVVRCACGRPAG